MPTAICVLSACRLYTINSTRRGLNVPLDLSRVRVRVCAVAESSCTCLHLRSRLTFMESSTDDRRRAGLVQPNVANKPSQ
jgi:hypothetical protein